MPLSLDSNFAFGSGSGPLVKGNNQRAPDIAMDGWPTWRQEQSHCGGQPSLRNEADANWGWGGARLGQPISVDIVPSNGSIAGSLQRVRGQLRSNSPRRLGRLWAKSWSSLASRGPLSTNLGRRWPMRSGLRPSSMNVAPVVRCRASRQSVVQNRLNLGEFGLRVDQVCGNVGRIWPEARQNNDPEWINV